MCVKLVVQSMMCCTLHTVLSMLFCDGPIDLFGSLMWSVEGIQCAVVQGVSTQQGPMW